MSKSKKSDKQAGVKVDEMRRGLKELMQREIANLPDLIEQLPPDQRINVVFKMMPYVLPRVESVNAKSGEALDWNLGLYD